MKELSSLFEPIKIGDMELRNRIIMAPMGTSFAATDGSVSQQLIDHYAERAKGGAGLITVEGARIDSAPEGSTGLPGELRADDDRYIPGLRRLAEAIHKYEAKASLQLIHAGRYARQRVTGVQCVAPSAIPSRYTGEMPRELTTLEVEDLIEKFARAAERAREAGFDAVQLLSSTGYLIAQFLSGLTNKRTDRFGGDTLARTTFLTEIIQLIQQKLGKGFPIDCKISVDDFLPGGNNTEDAKIIARRLEEVGTSMLQAWAAWHESPVPMLPMSVPRGAFVYLAETIKSVVSLPVAAVCRINEPRLANQIIAEKRADLIVMGRALLADPYFPQKAAEGNFEDIRMCIACVHCFDCVMRGMREAKVYPVTCTVNAEVGREGEKRMSPAPTSKKVLIVGGGPAGMEAARVAALRGHKVTLWEEKDKLGGNLSLATIPPHKEELNNIINYLSSQMQKLGVRVELNKKATPEAILAERADEVIIATGASTLIPDIPGVEMKQVTTAIDVLKEGGEIGEEVVVIGGGLVGCETAEFLAEKGKKVAIVEMMQTIASDMGFGTRWVTLKRLRDIGIKMLTSTKVKSITEAGVVVEKDGETSTLRADSVVLAVGLKSEKGLSESLRDKLPRLHIIGDCSQVGQLREAIHDGWGIGCEV